MATETQKKNRTSLVSELLTPIMKDALTYTKTGHCEVLLRLIYERAHRRIQIKTEKVAITWLYMGNSNPLPLSYLSVNDQQIDDRLSITATEIAQDIKQVFGESYDMESLGNVEISMKFRDASLVSVLRTEYRHKKRCYFKGKSTLLG